MALWSNLGESISNSLSYDEGTCSSLCKWLNKTLWQTPLETLSVYCMCTVCVCVCVCATAYIIYQLCHCRHQSTNVTVCDSEAWPARFDMLWAQFHRFIRIHSYLLLLLPPLFCVQLRNRAYWWSGEGTREHDETATTTSHTLSTVFW